MTTKNLSGFSVGSLITVSSPARPNVLNEHPDSTRPYALFVGDLEMGDVCIVMNELQFSKNWGCDICNVLTRYGLGWVALPFFKSCVPHAEDSSKH